MAGLFDNQGPDYQSTKKAAGRFNLGISPKSSEWKKVYGRFEKLLRSKKTIQSILAEHFTHHEARMLILSDRDDVKALQADNTERFNALLEGRLKGVGRNLGTKLTMLYFGLPIEPLISPLDELEMEFRGQKDDGPRYTIQPPLHFLTAHDNRNWGKDALRGREAYNYGMPIPKGQEPILGLRGGDADVPQYEDDSVDYKPDSEIPALPQDEWISLFGLNGSIPIVPRKWHSFGTAVRQLLGLQISDEDPHEFTLVAFEKKTGHVQETIHDILPLHHQSPSMEYLREHFQDCTTKSHEECCYFFVTLPSQTAPLGPTPQSEQFKTDIVKISHNVFGVDKGVGADTLGTAYLPLPKCKEASFTINAFPSNHSNTHLKTTLETLVKRPETSPNLTASCHHGLFRFTDAKRPGSRAKTPYIYGALGHPQWLMEMLHPLNNPNADWRLNYQPLESDTIALVIPNFYPKKGPALLGNVKRPGVKRFKSAWRVLKDLLHEAYDVDDMLRMNSLYLLPGNQLVSTNHGQEIVAYRIPISDLTNRDTHESLADFLMEEANNPDASFFTIHPQWKVGESRVFPTWATEEVNFVFDVPPMGCELFDFRDVVSNIYNTLNPDALIDENIDHILIKSIPPWDSTKAPSMDYPAFLIGPDTTEDEWFEIRANMTARDFSVKVIKKAEAHWANSIAKSNIWGPRISDSTAKDNTKPPKRSLLTVEEFEPETRRCSDNEEEKVGFNEYEDEEVPDTPSFKSQGDNTDSGDELGGTSTPRPGTTMKWLRRVPPTAESANESSSEASGTKGVSTSRSSNQQTSDVLAGQRSLKDIASEVRTRSRSDRMDIDSGDDGNTSGSGSRRGSDLFTPTEAEPPSMRFAPFREPEGMDERTRTWAEQPSIFDGYDPLAWPSCQDIDIPTTAIPRERIFRTTDGVPMISKAVMTLTEQRKLQSDFWTIRNIALMRALPCPYKDCEFTYRIDETEGMEAHLATSHRIEECMWCDNRLYKWRNPEQRMNHMREKHQDRLREALNTKPTVNAQASTFDTDYESDPENPWRRSRFGRQDRSRGKRVKFNEQSTQSQRLTGNIPFIALGPLSDKDLLNRAATLIFARKTIKHRDILERQLDEVADEAWKRGVTPGVSTGSTAGETRDSKADTIIKNILSRPNRAAEGTRASSSREAAAERTSCLGPTGPLPPVPSMKGLPLAVMMNPTAMDVLSREGVISTELTRSRIPRLLSYPLAWHDQPGPLLHIDPCNNCPVPKCADGDISRMSSRQVYEHFEKSHADMKMEKCPFCYLPFIRKKAGRDDEKPITEFCLVEEVIKHFDCHVYSLWDLLDAEDSVEKLLASLSTTLARTATKPSTKKTPGAKTIINETTDKRAAREPKGIEEKATAQELTKCPYFETCGVCTDLMTEIQIRRHLRKSHGKEAQLFDSDEEEQLAPPEPRLKPKPEPSTAPEPSKTPERAPKEKPKEKPEEDTEMTETSQAQTTRSGASKNVAKESLAKPTPRKSIRRARAAAQESTTEGNKDDELSGATSDVTNTTTRSKRSTTKSTSKTPKATKQGEALKEMPDIAESGDESSIGRGRSREKKRRTGQDDSDYEDNGTEDDDEEEEDEQGMLYRRRAESPDWVKKLGPSDPNFQPDENMYCSRCLRKAPKTRDRSPGRDLNMGREKEMKMHTDHARSCNIRNGIGSGVKLPNRSGWIRKNDLPDKLGNIKDKFKKKYPAYSQTIYPTKTGSANSTIWNWDPNNDDNQPWWGIPWPPYEGRPPFPGNWSSGDLQFEFDTPERQRREGWQPKPVDDPAYRYQSDSDSADDLKPDEDDLEELAEEKQELLPDKKRRRQGTTAASSARGAGDDGAAGPATKRAKKSPPGKDGNEQSKAKASTPKEVESPPPTKDSTESTDDE